LASLATLEARKSIMLKKMVSIDNCKSKLLYAAVFLLVLTLFVLPGIFERKKTLVVEEPKWGLKRKLGSPPGEARVFRLEQIIIDAGHGGKDSGVVRKNICEKDITLAIALRLAAILKEKTRFNIHLTRVSDEKIALNERVAIVNLYPPDRSLLISLHCNSSHYRNVAGLETYIYALDGTTDEESAKLAEQENATEALNSTNGIVNHLHHRVNEKYSWEAAWHVQETLIERLNVRNRNVKAKDKQVKRGNFRVLSRTTIPAILVELGFMSNPNELQKLINANYQEQIVEALLEAIESFNEITAQWAKWQVVNENQIRRLEGWLEDYSFYPSIQATHLPYGSFASLKNSTIAISTLLR